MKVLRLAVVACATVASCIACSDAESDSHGPPDKQAHAIHGSASQEWPPDGIDHAASRWGSVAVVEIEYRHCEHRCADGSIPAPRTGCTATRVEGETKTSVCSGTPVEP